MSYSIREQLLSDPRSAELCQVSLDIVEHVEQRRYDEIEPLRTRLIEMGITSNIHVGLGEDAYEDPVTMAEYCAGQILSSSAPERVTESFALAAMHVVVNAFIVP